MLDGVPLAYWIGFHALVLALVVCDLGVLNRRAEAAQTRAQTGERTGAQTWSSLRFVLLLLALATGFGVWLTHVRGHETGLEFATGYLIEISLSIDNLFVFLVMFRAFGLSAEEQRKALLYGVLGAIVMRGALIFGGITLLRKFAWIQFVFGGFLMIAAMRLLGKKAEALPSGWMRWLAQRGGGKRAGAFVAAVIAIEAADLVFALDSIPAVLSITDKAFVVYTSNIFAVLGLRSLYFLLEGLLGRLRFLHIGLAAILAFVGAKMILARWVVIPIGLSLSAILVVMAIATVASYRWPRKTGAVRQES